MKYLFILVSLTWIVSCKSGSDGGGSAASSRSLFSEWTDMDTGAPLDLRQGQFDADTSIGFLMQGGQVCTCNLFFTGAPTLGSYEISLCELTSGTPDPGCAVINGIGTYEIEGSILTLCRSGVSCSSFN